MVATSIEYDFKKAAAFVARGNELEAAAAKTKIPFEDLKEYTEDYADDWNRLIKSERGLMLGQAGAEAVVEGHGGEKMSEFKRPRSRNRGRRSA